MSLAPRAARYRRVFRWHFFAGLFCLPFMLWLACTGAIYLFKPQVEELLDRPYAAVGAPGVPRAAEPVLVRAALAAYPGAEFRSYLLPRTPDAAAQILVARDETAYRVHVHPQSARVLKEEAEEDRPMRRIFHLHGELLLGDRGSNLVELAASWGIVLIVSGLYLHWPRGTRRFAGILYPRRLQGRAAWREWHAVTGMYVSLFTLFFLVSGLPWSAGWGGLLQTARADIAARVPAGHEEHASAMRDMPKLWTTGATDERRALAQAAANAKNLDDLPRVVRAAERLDLPPPVYIDAPKRTDPRAAWTIRSDTQNRPKRVTVTVDQAARVLARRDFASLDPVDRVVAVGVAAHEGQLFGLANQLLGLAVALGLIAACVGGARMWWLRRASEVPDAPAVDPRDARPYGFYAIVGTLAVLLPFLGGSLILVLIAEAIMSLRERRSYG